MEAVDSLSAPCLTTYLAAYYYWIHVSLYSTGVQLQTKTELAEEPTGVREWLLFSGSDLILLQSPLKNRVGIWLRS